jgi:uncharacterized membrane protein
MNLHGILLVLASAGCHATWNLMSKSATGRVDPALMFLRALGYSTLCYLPMAAILQPWAIYAPVFWLCVVPSGVCTGLYFYSLGRAYRAGHISIAYPIARSFPILVVTWAGLFMDEAPSALGLAGIVLVVAGCFVLPMKRFARGAEGAALHDYLNRSAAWALGAALFTAAFSVIDRLAARSVTPEAMTSLVSTRLVYVYVQNAVAWVTMMAMMRFHPPPERRTGHRRAIVAGLIFMISYGLIMVALTDNPVAYVVTFRQVSIVITATVSMVLIEKHFSWPRFVGVVAVFVGVVLVGLAG